MSLGDLLLTVYAREWQVYSPGLWYKHPEKLINCSHICWVKASYWYLFGHGKEEFRLSKHKCLPWNISKEIKYIVQKREIKKTKKKRKLRANPSVWIFHLYWKQISECGFFFFRLPRCKPPVPRKPSISPKPANLSRSPSVPTNQGDSMQRKQNLSEGNGNCNLAWNESSQETYLLYFWIYMIDIFLSMIKSFLNKITVVR